jgi:energy-coupling factor transporter ATP-binding protein EcfA2
VDALHEWARTLPIWQQQAMRYLLAQPKLQDDQRDEVLDLLLAEAGYERVTTREQPPQIERHEFSTDSETSELNRLRRLFGLRDVNALPGDTELRFEPEGLTIIYGPNGAGKSSYVRGLKRLCRTVDRDHSILPNVLRKGAGGGEPRAKIEWVPAGGGELRAQEFDLSDPRLRTPINSISVFDARCAQIYVDEENQLAFVPTSIRVLVRLAEEQMELQQRVDRLIEDAREKRPNMAAFPDGTAVRSGLAALTGKSTDEAIESLARLSDQQVARRNELELALAAAATGETERRHAQLLSEARLARELATLLQAASRPLSSGAVAQLRKAADAATKRREVARIAAEEAFAGEELTGVGSDPWKELWEAARRFHEHTHDEEPRAEAAAFPDTSEGADCPLCFQELDEMARDRFRRFEAFVRGDAEAQAARAEQALQTELARLDDGPLKRCRTPLLESLRETNAPLHQEVEQWLAVAETFRQRLLAGPASGEWPADELSAPPTTSVVAVAVAREREAETVTSAVKADEKPRLEAELAELKAREALQSRADEMKRWLAELREIASLEKAKAALRTQNISLKQKALTEQVVTKALKDQLRHELDTLGFTHIAVDLSARGVHGTTMLQLRLRDAPERELAAILSEGEKRALALAFFLSEITTAGHPGGIVLDDPVSSLDQERRHVIAKRIAAEAESRQVILFTHDIGFLFHTQVEADKLKIEPKMQQVWRVGASVGRTAADAPFEASRVKRRIGWLAKELQEMHKEHEFKTADEHRLRVSSWYDHLRRSWERAVEEIVFNEVVQRFAPQVQTNRLKKVAVSQQMLDDVEQGMTNCSNWVHDKPVAEGGALPSRAQMADDLRALEHFSKTYRPK